MRISPRKCFPFLVSQCFISAPSLKVNAIERVLEGNASCRKEIHSNMQVGDKRLDSSYYLSNNLSDFEHLYLSKHE